PDQTQNTVVKHKKHQIPNPPKFDGTRKKFQQWHLKITGKLHKDREAFRSDSVVFTYIYSQLENTAQAMASAY
ncbi:hypothetical protein LY76DRAFT_496086, partial [Colletotrichum caudatum]